MTPCRINSYLAYCCKQSFWLLASLAGTFGNRSFGGNLTAMLSLKPDEICVMTMASKPEITATTFDANIDSTTTEVADNAKFDMQKTTHYSAEGDLEILEQTEIYSAHFRTSSYSTFAEKMDGMSYGNIIPYQDYPYVYNIKCNFNDNTPQVENFDIVEYNYDNRDHNLIHIEPDYQNTPWYVNNVAPLMYGNSDLRMVVGNVAPPTHNDVVDIYMNTSYTVEVDDNMLETDDRLAMTNWNVINNHMEEYIDNDLCQWHDYVANKLTNASNRSTGVNAFMAANNIPVTTKGKYPVVVKYQLPGKTKVTTTKRIDLEYK